jgi:recombination protein RecA
MATAVHSFSEVVRKQVEQTLAAKGGAKGGAGLEPRFALAPRLVRDGLSTGFAGLDALLPGGFPVAGTTEIVGARSSGRATIAAACLAERTREGLVCAWVDVGGDLSPEAAAADGMDLERVLWVRCGKETKYAMDAGVSVRALSSGNYGRDKTVGTPGVANRALGEVRAVQVSEDRMPKRRGSVVLHSRPAILPTRYEKDQKKPVAGRVLAMSQKRDGEQMGVPRGTRRPWERLEHGIKAVDLLVQAGGFGAIVMDMGGIGAEFARRIPLATWFRWRVALERSRTSLLVLSPACGVGSQVGCAGSSAELVVRVQAQMPAAGTVMGGVSYRLEVVRRRFENEVEAGRKKAVAASSGWESQASWRVS